MIDEDYCRALASKFYVPGMDRDDLLQEARIAMWLNDRFPYRAAKLKVLDLVKIGQRRRFDTLGEREHPAPEVNWEAREQLRTLLALPRNATERRALAHRISGVPIGRGNYVIGSAWWRMKERATLLY